ncbi:hypothetical protein Pmani_006942 [Petrolisthes manimaculis]|uniref:Uncharacterized protein n=1 Tax=Petrolisthes manimaculis TaxID=1843537 RepID=A0AAE1Q8I6_9EUCA|nr:hypothetical protein Pmani_006942 [Petrolisthes manimaculis]
MWHKTRSGPGVSEGEWVGGYGCRKEVRIPGAHHDNHGALARDCPVRAGISGEMRIPDPVLATPTSYLLSWPSHGLPPTSGLHQSRLCYQDPLI